MELQTKIEGHEPTIHTQIKLRGEDVCKLIWRKQTEMKLSGANKKNVGIVINVILNEYIQLTK